MAYRLFLVVIWINLVFTDSRRHYLIESGGEDGMLFWINYDKWKAIPALHKWKKIDVDKGYIKKTVSHMFKKAFCRHSLQGSMTVEAALVIPMVFFVWIACVSWSSIVYVHETVQKELGNTAMELSIAAGENSSRIQNIGGLYAWGQMFQFDEFSAGGVDDVYGFDFSESQIMDGQDQRVDALHNDKAVILNIQLRNILFALAVAEIIFRKIARTVLDDGLETRFHKLDIECVDRLVVLRAVGQSGCVLRAEVEIVHRNDRGIHTELTEILFQKMRRGCFAARRRPRQHTDLRPAVMCNDIARNIFDVLPVGIFHFFDHHFGARKCRVVDLLQVVNVLNVPAREIAHISP